MKNQVLTKEQMEVLEELGVDISKASMCRVSLNIMTPATDESMLVENDKNFYGMSFPVFTVVDMIEIMPYSILDKHCDYYYFDLLKLDKSYTCFYRYITGVHIYHSGHCCTLVEAVYNVFLKLAKDGKLNNTPK